MMPTGSTRDAPPLQDIYTTPHPLVLVPSPKFMAANTEEELGHPIFVHLVPLSQEKRCSLWKTLNG